MKIRFGLIILIHCYCLNIFSDNRALIDSINKIKYDNPQGSIKRCREIIAQKNATEKYRFYTFIADSYWHLSNPDSALAYYNFALNSAKAEKAPIYEGMSLSNIGYIQVEKTLYNDALNNYFKAIEIFKSLNDSTQIYITQTYIGQVYYYIEKYDEALKIFFPLAERYKQKNDFYNACISYEMIGHLYRELKETDKAEANYLIALKFAEQSKNKKRLAEVKINYADFLMDLKEYDKGEVVILQAIEDLKTISAYNTIAVAYMQLGDYYHRIHQFSKAKNYLFKAVEIVEKSEHNYTLLDCYESLTQIYEDEGNWKEALLYHKKYKTLTDSVNKASTNKELLNLSAKYESDKKDKENELLQVKNQVSEKTIKEQQMVTYFIVIGLVLVSGLAFFIFRGLKFQRKANAIITAQKHLVEEHQKEILDSIHYAKRIQNTLLAHKDFLDENLPDNFVLFKPKDIVSGDFYWATKHGNKFYLAVCDSTGHGVPGAFMSLLNIGFLNEAINEKNILEPHKIFEHVRQRLIDSVSKDGQKDGFDGILLCIDKNTDVISYAAAHNAPLLVCDNEISELEKDKMPVGIGERKDTFKLHSIHLKKGDTLYLYTDGYADQFGGPKGKKFKYKALHDFLLANTSLPLNEQSERLFERFNEWRGNLEQVDDVLVVGVKI